MDDMYFYLIAFFAALFITMNIVATYVALKTDSVVKSRRYYQLLFVWIVPILGALLAIYLNREEYFEQHQK